MSTLKVVNIQHPSAASATLILDSSGNLALPAGSASTPALQGPSDTNTGLFFPTADTIAFAEGGTEALRIDSSGRVGIGTSAPAGLLHLSSTFGTTLTTGFRIDGIGTTTNNVAPISFYTQSSNWGTQHAANIACGNLSGTDGGGYLRFSTSPDGNTAPSERLRITAAGFVGIGTTSASTILHVASTAPYIRIQDTDSNTGVTAQGGFEMYDSDGDRLFYLANESSSSADVGLFNMAGGALKFGTSGSERGQFDSSGRLLVGTSSSPGSGDGQYSRLVIQGYVGANTSQGIMSLQRGVTASSITTGQGIGVISFNDSSGGTFSSIYCEADGNGGAGDYPGRLVFSTTADGAAGPTERMRIDNAGNLLLNATSVIDVSMFSANIKAATNFATLKAPDTNTYMAWQFQNSSGTRVGYIQFSTTATTFSTSSDYRLKENVTAVTDGIARLQQLKPSRFNFIADPDKTVDGFIAHEVQTVVPEAIQGEKDAVDADGNPVYQGIDQSKLVPLLTAALQEAVAKIESLEARLTAAGI